MYDTQPVAHVKDPLDETLNKKKAIVQKQFLYLTICFYTSHIDADLSIDNWQFSFIIY